MKTLSSLFVLALTLLGLTKTAEANPPNTHAVVHIRNDSEAKATVYYKFSDDKKWRHQVTEIGETVTLSYRYHGDESVSPHCWVKIDVDTNGRNIFHYALGKGAAPDPHDLRFGAYYTLKQIPGTNTRYLDAMNSKAHVRIIEKDSFIPTTVD